MPMKLAPALIVLSLVAACASGVPAPTFTEGRQPIINGVTDTTDTAVVALVYQGQQFCTGTVIAKRAVVTAGHCLIESGYTAADITVFFGTKVGGSGQSIGATNWVAHPSYYTDSDGAPIYDVSIITLAKDSPVAPVTWQSTALANIVNKNVTMVGYGVTNGNTQTGGGTRRKVTVTITSQDSQFIYYGGNKGTCVGDSGGPTFLNQNGTPTLIAVTSYGDENCVQFGANTRLDTYADFISQQVSGGGGTGGGGTGGSSDGLCGSGNTTGDDSLDTCLSTNCCAEFDACLASAKCTACLSSPSSAGCSSNATFLQFTSCWDSSCTSSGGGSSGGSTSGVCGYTGSFGDASLDECVNDNCCDEFDACHASSSCKACLANPNATGCSRNSKFKAFNACLNGNYC